MENASKALIIAGAILISILIISVGIMIFNSSSGLFSSATSKMSDQEKQLFNSTFTMYEGTRVSGSSVKELIRAVIANNMDEENPIIKINENNAPDTVEEFKTGTGADAQVIRNALQYTVTCTLENGVVNNINISITGAS